MLDISILENGSFTPDDRKNIVDFLLRTDEEQKWTTASTVNNAYSMPGHKYELLPELEDRKYFRREVLMAMKDCTPESLVCDKYTVTIWKKTGDVTYADILKTVIYEIRDSKGITGFFADSYMFALHAEDRIHLNVYRLYCDTGVVRVPVVDPLINLSEEELEERYLETNVSRECEEPEHAR